MPEITWVELSSGRRLDSALLVCPTCKTLDVNTDLDTSRWPQVVATCPLDHSWTFVATEGNVERAN